MPSSAAPGFRDKIMVVPYAFLSPPAAADEPDDDKAYGPYIVMFKDARHREWGPVSGGRKRGESATAAAARELEEESNGVLSLSLTQQTRSRDRCDHRPDGRPPSCLVFHTNYRPPELRCVDTIRNGGEPIAVRSRYTMLLFRLPGIRSHADVARFRDAYFVDTKKKNDETCDMGVFRVTPHGVETSSHQDQEVWDFVRQECVPRLVAFFFPPPPVDERLSENI